MELLPIFTAFTKRVHLEIKADEPACPTLKPECRIEPLDTGQAAGAGKKNRTAVVIDGVVFYRHPFVLLPQIRQRKGFQLFGQFCTSHYFQQLLSLAIIGDVVKMFAAAVKEKILFAAVTGKDSLR